MCPEWDFILCFIYEMRTHLNSHTICMRSKQFRHQLWGLNYSQAGPDQTAGRPMKTTKKNLVRQKPSSINCVPYIKNETSFGRRAQPELCHEATFAKITYPTQFLDHSWPIRQLFPATVGNKYSKQCFFWVLLIWEDQSATLLCTHIQYTLYITVYQ